MKKRRKTSAASGHVATPDPPPIPSRGREALRTLAELALICGFLFWYHAPYLELGLPPGDFASDLMATVNENRLIPTPLDFPIWNPDVMCGRPEVGFWRPFRLFELPFSGMDPLAAQKAGVVLFHLLAGLAMYALVRQSGAGRIAAVFAGITYPIMPAHIARAAVHGHVHIVRFYALVPLLMLAYFRIRQRDLRGVVLLGLALAACLFVDAQRALLTAVMLGILLTLEVAMRLLARLFGTPGAVVPSLTRLVQFGTAFVLAVTLTSFEMVNGFVGDSYRKGFSNRKLTQDLKRWSNDTFYTFVDRKGIIADALEDVGDFDESHSRYVGLSLLLLLLVALAIAPTEQRFGLRTMTALALLSIWLASGPEAPTDDVLERWGAVFASSEVGLMVKGIAVAFFVGLGGFASWLVARALGRRWSPPVTWGIGIGATLTAAALLLYTTPYPLVKKVVFFLRDQRNPDWFHAAVLSMSVCYGAALGIGALAARWSGKRWGVALAIGLGLVCVWDFSIYRSRLTSRQLKPRQLRQMQQAARIIGRDRDDFRVIGDTPYNNYSDGLAVWHGKRLAWDYRLVTAPLRTRTLMYQIHAMTHKGSRSTVLATLAGLANIKYIVDPHPPSLRPAKGVRLVKRTGFVDVWENQRWRPMVQAWPEAHLLISRNDDKLAAILTALLADQGIAVVYVDNRPDPAILDEFGRVFANDTAHKSGMAPDDASIVGVGDGLGLEKPKPFTTQPLTTFDRPEPHRIRVETESAEPFFLTVAESFHPSWRAQLDGQQPLTVHAANVAFLGVFVPAGEHTIEFTYSRHWSHFLWLAVSLVSLVVCLIYLVATRSNASEDQPAS